MQRPSPAIAIGAWFCYLLLIAPSLIVIPMSFNDTTELVFPPTSLSLRLYREFLFGSDWLAATRQSFVVAICAAVLSIVAGVPASYALVRAEFPGKRILSMILLAPMLVPVIVVALGLYLYFSSLGLSGTTLGLVLGHTMLTTPFVMVVAMASLRHIDPNLEIAAKVMGAGQGLVFRRVVLPLLMPAVWAGLLFAFLISFDEVVAAWFISGVGTSTLPVKMYSAIHWEVSPVLPVVSTLLTALSLAVCVIGGLLQERGRHDV